MTRGLNRRSKAAAVLAAGAMCVSACGGGTTGQAAPDLPVIELTADDAMLAAAVDRTTAIDTFRYAMVMELSVPGEESMRFEIDGAMDTSRGAMSMTMDMSGLADQLGGEIDEMGDLFGGSTMEMVQVGDTAYLRAPGLAEMLGGDADWIALPSDQSSDLTGLGLGIDVEGPEAFLEGMPEGADIVDMGREDLRGVAVTKFRAEMPTAAADDDLSAAFAELGSAGPVYVWIDDQGLVRRMELSFDLFGIGGGIVIEMFDFGAGVDIDVPSDVTELDPRLLGAFG